MGGWGSMRAIPRLGVASGRRASLLGLCRPGTCPLPPAQASRVRARGVVSRHAREGCGSKGWDQCVRVKCG